MNLHSKNLIEEFLAENWQQFESWCDKLEEDAEQVADDLKNTETTND